MKKIHLAVLCALCFVCACDKKTTGFENNKIKVVVTTPPLYDWTSTIVGSLSNIVDITTLQVSGEDLHEYQPTARDIIDIGKADIFIHIGGVSDSWVEKTLDQIEKPDRKIISALSCVKGMIKKDCHCKCTHSNDSHTSNHDHKDAFDMPDEHIWLSLRFAQKICMEIATHLAGKSADHKETFLNNAKKYCLHLSELDESFLRHTSTAKNKTVIIADRFPFMHFFNDYKLSHFAAFEGCSAETDAGFQTIMRLSKNLNDLDTSFIYILEGGDERIAQKTIETAKKKDVAILRLNSLQNVPLKKLSSLGGYLEVMKKNIEELKKSVK
jgi:zinc transport system substrate-binding protein